MNKAHAVLRACAMSAALAQTVFFAGTAFAGETAYALTIQGGKFEPSTLSVKAGVKFKLTVSNKGAKAAEFESAELNREKVIPAGTNAVIYIGPLAPGTYPFFDDFDQKNSGRIVAK